MIENIMENIVENEISHILVVTQNLYTKDKFNWNNTNWTLEIAGLTNDNMTHLITIGNIILEIDTIDNYIVFNKIIQYKLPPLYNNSWFRISISRKTNDLHILLINYNQDSLDNDRNAIAVYNDFFLSTNIPETTIKILEKNCYLTYLYTHFDISKYYQYNDLMIDNDEVLSPSQYITKICPFDNSIINTKYKVNQYQEYKKKILEDHIKLDNILKKAYQDDVYNLWDVNDS